jgi:hypothetical protein
MTRPNKGAACAKHTAEDVAAIRAAYAAGEPTSSIGARFGVAKRRVGVIAFGGCYGWVPGALPAEMKRRGGR